MVTDSNPLTWIWPGFVQSLSLKLDLVLSMSHFCATMSSTCNSSSAHVWRESLISEVTSEELTKTHLLLSYLIQSKTQSVTESCTVIYLCCNWTHRSSNTEQKDSKVREDTWRESPALLICHSSAWLLKVILWFYMEESRTALLLQSNSL